MPHPSTRLLCLPLLLAACPPLLAEPETSTEAGTSTSTAGATSTSTDPTTTTEPTSTSPDPSTTGGSEDSSGGVSATDAGTTSTTGATTTSTTDPDSTDTGFDTTTGSSTTGLDTTGDTSTSGDTNDIPDTTGGEVCGDEPDEVDIAWNLEFPPGIEGNVAADCTIMMSQKLGSEVTTTFSCNLFGQQEMVVLTYALLPNHDYPWYAGYEVQLDYRVEQPWWKNEWLKIRGGSTSFSAIRADALAPPGTTVYEFFELKFDLWALCDPVPDVCGQRQGLAITVPNPRGDYGSLVLKSGEHGQWGAPYSEHHYVDHASRLLDPVICDDVASTWIDTLIMFDLTGI